MNKLKAAGTILVNLVVLSGGLLIPLYSNPKSVNALNQVHNQSNINSIFSNRTLYSLRIRPPRKRGGGRDPSLSLCLITPGKLDRAYTDSDPNADTFFSQTPTFIWEQDARVTRITIEYRGGEDLILWSRSIDDLVQSITYPDDAPPLLPGKRYKLTLNYEREKDGQIFTGSEERFFKIQEEDRDTIEQELEVLRNNLSQPTPYQIAMSEAEYFADKGLWTEAYSRIFAISGADLSAEDQQGWKEQKQEIEQVCNPE